MFLEEVTQMEDFIEDAALFSDVFAACGMKIVLSGTDSLGFLFTEDEQLYDRCILLHTTFIPYREFESVLGIHGIDEYIRNGGTMFFYVLEMSEIYTDAGLAAYSGVLDTIEAKSLPQIYAAAAEAYSAQDYQTALADYTVLAARNYSDSDKRLFLTNAHLCDSLGQLALAAGMTNAQAAQKLMELIGFSDTNQVIMRDDSYAQALLTGSWSSDAGELTVADDGTVTCSLPGLSGKECSLRDGAIYAGTGEDAVAFYRFSVLSDRMMLAAAVGDGRAYTMFRQ